MDCSKILILILVAAAQAVAFGQSSDSLSVVDRAALPVDVLAVQPLPRVDAILGYPRPVGQFRGLTPEDCQCRAARNSTLGNLLDSERRAQASSESGGCCDHGADNSQTYDVLRTAALEARNKSAGDALNLLYLLAQCEAQMDLAGRGLAECRAAVESVEKLRRQGIKLPADDGQFHHQEIAFRNQQALLTNQIGQLNAQLWQLIGLTPAAPEERIWPLVDLRAVVEPQDIDAEVSYGLQMRPELRQLRRLRGNVDVDSLPAIRAALGQANPLMGLAPQSSSGGLFGSLKKLKAAQRELPERQRQLNQYSRQREQEVTIEIRLAAAKVELCLRQISLAKEAHDRFQRERSDVESRAGIGRATFADVAAARLALLKSEGELLERVVDWRIAQVRLKQAQGLLVAECCP